MLLKEFMQLMRMRRRQWARDEGRGRLRPWWLWHSPLFPISHEAEEAPVDHAASKGVSRDQAF